MIIRMVYPHLGLIALFVVSIFVVMLFLTAFANAAVPAAVETEEEQIRARWAQISAEAVEIPFEEILTDGEQLVTDGSVNYIPRLEELMAKCNEEYKADGKMRVIKFPAGTFNFPVENPSANCVSGVGFRGAGKTADGKYLTKLTPAKTILSTNPDYSNDQTHDDIILDCFEIDCSNQVVVDSIGKFWYVYKAIYVERVNNWWMNDIYAHDSLGTLFGLDYIYSEGVYHIDCIAENSGRSASAPANVSSPGAGYGITSGRFENEPCKFVGCVAKNCRTGGYYFEIRDNKVDHPTGYSILNSTAYGCSFGVDDQGVDDLIIEDSEFYGNTSYGIRRGGTLSGAGANALPGDMYCKNTKIYSNGSVSNAAIRSAGVSFTEYCQEEGKNDTSRQVFEDCEIYNNRGYGISNTYSVPRYIDLKGSTKIYNNGGSGIHLRAGKDSTELVTLTTEGDNVEIFNNGMCGDSSLYTADGAGATGVFGDGITLSVNSSDNNMKFKAYGNKSRAVAFREYMGNNDFVIENGTYAGDWTQQTSCYPFRDEIGGVDNAVNAVMASFDDNENYTNYAYNGNGNSAGDKKYNITSSDEGVTISQANDAADGDYFKITQPAAESGTSRRFFAQFGCNTQAGTVPLNTMMMCSVLIKPNKEFTIRTNGKVSEGSIMTEYKEADSYTHKTLPANVWTRVDMANACVNNSTVPVFNFAFTEKSPTVDTEILVKNIMFLDKPDVIDYFSGAENGGEWTDPSKAYNSPSTKSVAIEMPGDINRAPKVNAGEDIATALPVKTISLKGTVSDDGKPGTGITTEWSKVSGPGTVTFTNPTSLETDCTFSEAGVYVINLTASDGEFTSADSITVTIDGNMPVSIDKISAQDKKALSMDVTVSGVLSVNAKGIIAVYDSEGQTMLGVMSSDNVLEAGCQGGAQFTFGTGLPFNDGNIIKGFVWAADIDSDLSIYPLSEFITCNSSDFDFVEIKINTSDDTFTQGGSKADKNFATWDSLQIKNDPDDNYLRKGYIKFDLSGIEQSSVQKAVLRLYGKVGGSTENTLNVYSVADDSWKESTLTASNAPGMSTVVGSLTFNQTTQYQEVDITDYVAEQFSIDKLVSIGLAGTDNAIFTIYTKESSTKPELILYCN